MAVEESVLGESNVGIVNFVDMINFLININLTVIKEKQYKYYTLIKKSTIVQYIINK
jgi:hypothetical protein